MDKSPQSPILDTGQIPKGAGSTQKNVLELRTVLRDISHRKGDAMKRTGVTLAQKFNDLPTPKCPKK
jgi:hypothetical protein